MKNTMLACFLIFSLFSSTFLLHGTADPYCYATFNNIMISGNNFTTSEVGITDIVSCLKMCILLNQNINTTFYIAANYEDPCIGSYCCSCVEFYNAVIPTTNVISAFFGEGVTDGNPSECFEF
jgi:hypothetical protein